ncbi:MAG: DMT family transporter [Alphaproteobacteria bacterium]|nr:DMT family transporter [Alphaproteobacteria bacterium]
MVDSVNATHRGPRYPLGIAMIATAGVFVSFVGLTIRYIEAADGWQILFYRSLGFAFAIGLFMVMRDRGQVFEKARRIGVAGAALAFFLALNFALYIFAILNTTVASMVFMVSATPVFAAVLGWIVLGERVKLVTWIAIFAAMTGVALMLGGGFLGGTLFGDLIALAAVSTYAVVIVILRHKRNVGLIPAVFLAGLLAAFFAALMAPDLAVSVHDIALSLCMGALQLGIGFVLLTTGSRYVPAAEVALLVLTETVLGPLWVWIAIGEVPPPLTLIGAFVVLCAVAGQAIVGLRDRPDYLPGVG